MADKFTEVSDDDLAMVKTSLRVDYPDDDKLIKSLVLTARADIAGQVGEQVPGFYDDPKIADLFDTAVILEVGHLYTNRAATSTTQYYEVPMALYSLINAMKDTYRLKVSQLDQTNGGEDDGQEHQSQSDATTPGVRQEGTGQTDQS